MNTHKTLRNKLEIFITNSWYKKAKWLYLLAPFSYLFAFIAKIRRHFLTSHSKKFPIPVIIIGNITVGGTGKTPLTIHLANLLQTSGYKVGILTRGFGAQTKQKQPPLLVQTDNMDPQIVGDETCLLAKHTKCLVAVDHNRTRAAKFLINVHKCNILLSDDGLQHYNLARDIEIILIDGKRKFGNELCLPAGPLREPISRLKNADFLIATDGTYKTAYTMNLIATKLHNLKTGKTLKANNDKIQKCHAVAGIGNPQRFFTTLEKAGYNITKKHIFPDHHSFTASNLNFNDNTPIIMTEKDAVKCKQFASNNMWYLEVQASLGDEFNERFIKAVDAVKNL
ncbi:MAG: tetraacyldisaccharide 4'-kinase [Thiotrichales bacterium]|nr:MAG: tetraacyldisaccharide 4'-kinase [Thiotrichales bacterium]